MPQTESQSNRDLSGVEVFTLAETAAFLRVPEEAVLELVKKGDLPAQRIGNEWRFLKRAVVDWLRFGSLYPHEVRMFPYPWMLEHPFWEELVAVLEQRILSKLPTAEKSAKPGSKQAVLKHFGIFKDDGDLKKQLADLRARREAASE